MDDLELMSRLEVISTRLDEIRDVLARISTNLSGPSDEAIGQKLSAIEVKVLNEDL